MPLARSRGMPIFEIAVPSTFQNAPRPTPQTLWVEAANETRLSMLEHLPYAGLAVVGTRHPQQRSLRFTRDLIEGLAAHPRIIVSGLALGIDQAAHEAALVFGLPTLAVLGCGHEHHYPDGSHEIRARIVEAGGLVLSEFAPSEEPRPYRFVQRNRLIAAAASATCLIEAGHRSGALITADYAFQLERPVFALPNFPGERSFEGNQRLLDGHTALPLWGPHSLGSVWLDLATSGSATAGKNFRAARRFMSDQNARGLKKTPSSL